MEQQAFQLSPELAPDMRVHVRDDRGTTRADDDLVEVGLRTTRGGGSGIAVALSLDEIVRLRDALNMVIDRQLPPSAD